MTIDPTFLPPPGAPMPLMGEIYNAAFWRAISFSWYERVPGDIMEFGVRNGFTARILAQTMNGCSAPDKEDFAFAQARKLWLFDSWEGLPEPTGNDREMMEVKEGYWQKRRCFPAYEGTEEKIGQSLTLLLGERRVCTVKGWYEETVPKVLHAEPSPCVVHLDCDYYSSTKQVLRWLKPQPGQVLLFDDWNANLASDRTGERRAFLEWESGLSQWGLTAERWFSYGWFGQAILIHH